MLKWIASLVWLAGGMVLGGKAFELLLEAREMNPDGMGHWVGLGVGGIVGVVKSHYLFSRSFRRNVARIDALPTPRPWLFFRPAFFPLLVAMILLGVVLSRISKGDYLLLVMVGALDVSLATALCLSFGVNVGSRLDV